MFYHIYSLLFPLRCIGCNKKSVALCETCLKEIPLAPPIADSSVYAVFAYSNTIVERSIRDLKYYHREEAALTLMKNAVPYIAEFLSNTIQVVTDTPIVFVPIPQHRRKLDMRGYNQSERLASILSQSIPHSSLEILLTKYRQTIPQAKIQKRSFRLQNVKDSMRPIKKPNPKAIYVLVDDVTTTGATFAEANRALLNVGATKILSVALAHGYSRK